MDRIILGVGSRYPQTMRNERELVTIPARDLMHIHVIGKSGYGKSFWLATFFLMLLSCGISATIVDVSGDLSRLVLRLLIATGFFQSHPDAFSRLIYLNLPHAAKRRLYAPFNVLDTTFDPYSASDMVMEAFRRASPALKGGTYTNIETLIKIGSFVLASHKLPLLPYLYYLFTDAAFRERLLAGIRDEVVLRSFAQFGFTRAGDVPTAMQPTLKRINLLAFDQELRYSLGQQHNLLDFRALLTEGRSLLINLNLPSPDARRLLGCLTTVYAEMGAKSRGDIAAEQRTGKHVLILDEFQNFVAQSGEALSAICEECRKYGLYLCLANQYWGQVPENLRGALNQCEIALAFHLERSDAAVSADLLSFPHEELLPKPVFVNPHRRQYATPQFYSRNEQRDLHIDAITKLPKREAFARLPSREHGSVTYKMRTLDADDSGVNQRTLEEIEEAYFSRYFRSQSDIEAEITARLHGILSSRVHRSQDVNSGYYSSTSDIITPLPLAHANNIQQEEGFASDGEAESLRD
jgi:hypothetical protein